MAIGKIKTSAVSYPVGVRALGLQSVWNLRMTAGITSAQSALTKTSVSTPAGWSYDAGLWYGPVATPWTLDNYFVDNGQLVQRTGTATVTNCYFNNPAPAESTSGAYSACWSQGQITTPCTATFTNCTFDGTGMIYYLVPGNPGTFGAASIVRGTFDTTMSLTNCRIEHTPLCCFKTTSQGTTTLTNCYFGTYGFDPKADSIGGAGANSHMEQVFFDGGTWNISNCFFDCSGQDTDPLALVSTAQLYAQADTSGNLTVNFTNCIINGASVISAASGGTYWMQFAGKNGKVCTVTFNNCAIDAGKGRSVTAVGGGSVSISGSGNVDLSTGAAFAVAYP